MGSETRKLVVRYGSVFLLTIAALGISKLLAPFIEPNYLLPFIAAVLISAAFFGRHGGISAAVFAVALVGYVYQPNCLTDWHAAIRVATFGVVAALIVQLTHEMRSSQARTAAMLSSINDAVVVTDKHGCITFLNPSAASLSGKTLDEARRRPINEVFALRNEQTGEPESISLDEVLKKGEILPALESGLFSPREGSQISLEESAAPIRDESGRITGAVLLLRDVTKRRQVQDQLSQSQKMDAIGRLAGGVAGDFNNLLTVITGYSEMLTAEMDTQNPLHRFAEEIFTAAERAAGLTRQLLALSRGQLVQTQIIDLNALLNNMEKMLKRLLGDPIDLILLPGDGLGKIKSDPGQVEQVIVNLAMNSRDAMPKGGTFVVQTSNVEMPLGGENRLPGLEPGNYVLIVVSDTGVGMDNLTRSRLFEPFFTTKTQGKGSGLGLSIVYGIVRQNQGHINVYSQVGAGTIVEVYFPRAKDTPEVGRVKHRSGPSGTETVLIADDEDSVRKLVMAVLATNGYTVLEARDGQEALELYNQQRSRVDLVLTDVVMPRMNGFELGKQVTQLDPHRKLLFMSGYRDNQTGSGDEPPRVLLHKPFTPDALLKKVREVLDGRPGGVSS